MRTISTDAAVYTSPAIDAVGKAREEVSASFERLCLTAGIQALSAMMEQDAEEACGARHVRSGSRRGYRWGRTTGKIGFHGGKIDVERPRVRAPAGKEMVLPSWEQAIAEDWLGEWAVNQMLLNVSTRKFQRSVRLPEGDVPTLAGAGLSKSAASRRFVALSAERMKEWMTKDLSGLDILVVQIDGIHISENLVLVAAVGIDGGGEKHPLALMEGATETSAVVQALIDNLIERGLDPAMPRLLSSTAQRRSPRRSGAASVAARRSSGARYTRRATSPSGCPSHCMPPCGARCVRPGSSTMPTGPRS
jgi:putative transposase